MEKRFDSYLNNETLIIATHLDPRYKNSLFSASRDSVTDELSNTNVHNIKETLASALLKKKQQEVEHQNQISSSSEAESDGDALDLDANVAPNDEDDLGEFDFDACLQEIVSHCSSQTRTEGAAAGRKGSKDKKQAQQQCQDSMVRGHRA